MASLRATAGNLRDHVIYCLALGSYHPRSITVTDVHGPTARENGDPHDRAERKRAVGGGQGMHVEALTARRALSVVRLPVPRGLSCLRAVKLDRCGKG